MQDDEREVVQKLYAAIKEEETVLCFDEKRGIGIISLVEVRTTETKLLPAAEILPLVVRSAVNE